MEETTLTGAVSEQAVITEQAFPGLLLGFFDWLSTFVWALVTVVIVFSFFVRAVHVNGSSMMPLLSHKDTLLVWEIGYTPKQGDVVVISATNSFEKPIVKRVIATEGDTVFIDKKTFEVFVNGQKLDEPYINEPMTNAGDKDYPFTVPAGLVFVMGDNRNVSMDSRSDEVGAVDVRYIMGKAVCRLLPAKRFNLF